MRLELSAGSLNLALAAGGRRTGPQPRLRKALGAPLCWGRGKRHRLPFAVTNPGIAVYSLGANLWSSFSLCTQRMKLIAKLTSKSSLLHVWDNPGGFLFFKLKHVRREKDRRISTLAKPCCQPPELQICELLHGMRALCFYLPAQRMSSALCKQMFCPLKREKRRGKKKEKGDRASTGGRERARARLLSADVNQDFSLGLTCQSCKRRIHEFSSWIVSIIKQENCEV